MDNFLDLEIEDDIDFGEFNTEPEEEEGNMGNISSNDYTNNTQPSAAAADSGILNRVTNLFGYNNGTNVNNSSGNGENKAAALGRASTTHYNWGNKENSATPRDTSAIERRFLFRKMLDKLTLWKTRKYTNANFNSESDFDDVKEEYDFINAKRHELSWKKFMQGSAIEVAQSIERTCEQLENPMGIDLQAFGITLEENIDEFDEELDALYDSYGHIKLPVELQVVAKIGHLMAKVSKTNYMNTQIAKAPPEFQEILANDPVLMERFQNSAKMEANKRTGGQFYPESDQAPNKKRPREPPITLNSRTLEKEDRNLKNNDIMFHEQGIDISQPQMKIARRPDMRGPSRLTSIPSISTISAIPSTTNNNDDSDEEDYDVVDIPMPPPTRKRRISEKKAFSIDI